MSKTDQLPAQNGSCAVNGTASLGHLRRGWERTVYINTTFPLLWPYLHHYQIFPLQKQLRQKEGWKH